MSTFEQFVEHTINLTTEEELFRAYQFELEKVGFDRVVYTLVTNHPSIQKPAYHGVLSNYPEDWMKHYRNCEFEKIDPVIKVAAVSRTPFYWADIMAQPKWTPAQRKFMCEGDEAGLHDGACVPIFGGPGEVAGVGLASSAGGVETTKHLLHMVRAITTQFHFRYCELEVERIGSENAEIEINISPREREVLYWCAEGKSESVIADILGIGQDVVKFHKKNVYKKLQVSDKTMAVLKAMRLGLINPYNLR